MAEARRARGDRVGYPGRDGSVRGGLCRARRLAAVLLLLQVACGDEPYGGPTVQPAAYRTSESSEIARLLKDLSAERAKTLRLEEEARELGLRVRILESLMQADGPPDQVMKEEAEVDRPSDTLEIDLPGDAVDRKPAGSPAEQPPGVLVPSPGEPTLVTVFYGTDRDRSLGGWRVLWWPWCRTLFVLAASFAVPNVLRRLLKPTLQPWFIIPVRIACLMGTAWSGIAAAQTTSLEFQAARTLPIRYGSERRPWDVAPYEAGTCRVSIPPLHEVGRIEEAGLHYFEFVVDPALHFMLADVSPLAEDAFFRELRSSVLQSPRRDAFLFVHGFNNTFQDAAFRTAQIAHDLEFEGAPIFFSWPSVGEIAGYLTDENNVQAAVAHLESFMADLVAKGGIEELHLVAHSMGSRALAHAMQRLGVKLGTRRLGEVILAAPDIDADTFRALADDIRNASRRVTLYASANDPALVLSREVHGGRYVRAGEGRPPLVLPGVDTIDVSDVAPGHAYVSRSGRILADVKAILEDRRVLDDSIAVRIPVLVPPNGVYWVLKDG